MNIIAVRQSISMHYYSVDMKVKTLFVRFVFEVIDIYIYIYMKILIFNFKLKGTFREFVRFLKSDQQVEARFQFHFIMVKTL